MAWPRTLWYGLAAAGILGFFGPDYALAVGAKQGLPMVMQVALRCGAKANKRDVPSSATPLAYAAAGGHLEATRILLQAGAYHSPVSRLTVGLSVVALSEQHSVAPDPLVELVGSDMGVYKSAGIGSMPLHYASEAGHVEVVKLLLAHGAPVNALSSIGTTPLILAAKHLDVVKVLVNHGANVNAQSSDGTTPLIAATALGDDGQAAKWLLEHGASTKIHDLDGVTPLHLAAERGFKDLVDSMMVHGADPMARDRDSVTALMLCASNDAHEGLARALIAHSQAHHEQGLLLVTAKSKKDQVTALHLAARAGATDMVKLLLAKGANPNARDAQGATPSIEAAAHGHRPVVVALVAAGAMVSVPDYAANTSLQKAQQHGAYLVARASGKNNYHGKSLGASASGSRQQY